MPEVPKPIPPERTVTAMPVAEKDLPVLERARDLLAHGNLEGSMGEYSRLIRKGKYLEEIIHDLKEAVYKHPVDMSIWQTLGDANFRSNRLQEALDAYGKAEGLLR